MAASTSTPWIIITMPLSFQIYTSLLHHCITYDSFTVHVELEEENIVFTLYITPHIHYSALNSYYLKSKYLILNFYTFNLLY